MYKNIVRAIYDQAPLLEAVVKQYGDMTIHEYLDTLKNHSSGNIDLREDIPDVIKSYLLEHTDEITACGIAKVLSDTGYLLTANHHQVEFMLDFLHGNLLYDYHLESLLADRDNLIPILSTASITMTCNTYPKGMLLYNTRHHAVYKLPIFSNRFKNETVLFTDHFTEDMVRNAREKAFKAYKNGFISRKEADAAIRILDEVYLDERVLAADDYSKQVTFANMLLSQGYFRDRQRSYVYIPLEEVAAGLIIRDLGNEDSLLYRLIMDKSILKKLLIRLKGVTGCWNDHKTGTVLFWGVDDKHRKIHLSFDDTMSLLRGRDLDGREYTYEYTHDHIIEYLKEKKIFPGLFASYTVIAFARDYYVLGGCFQGAYLKNMVDGLSSVLSEAGGFTRELDVLKKKRFLLLSGMTLDLYADTECLLPASSVELWDRPISHEAFTDALSIKVDKAIELSNIIMYERVIPAPSRVENWSRYIYEGVNASIKN